MEQLDRRLRGAGVDRDADVSLERDRDIALEDKRHAQRPHQPLGDEAGVRRAVEVVEEGTQLVLAQTGEAVGRADQALKPLGDLHHQPVGGITPHPLLDGRDRTGQVDDHDRDRMDVPRPPVQGVLQAIVKEHPAREVGQGIAEGRGSEDVRVVLAGGDTADQLSVLEAGQSERGMGCELRDGGRLDRGEGHGAEHRQLPEKGAAGPEREAEEGLLVGVLGEDQVPAAGARGGDPDRAARRQRGGRRPDGSGHLRLAGRAHQLERRLGERVGPLRPPLGDAVQVGGVDHGQRDTPVQGGDLTLHPRRLNALHGSDASTSFPCHGSWSFFEQPVKRAR